MWFIKQRLRNNGFESAVTFRSQGQGHMLEKKTQNWLFCSCLS